MKQVRKRDGRLQKFDFEKIKNAIMKAFREKEFLPSKNELERLFARIVLRIENLTDDVIDLEDIQDINEQELMSAGFLDVAKAYIIYRYRHNEERDKLYEKKLKGTQIENQNANVDEHSFSGRIGEAASVMNKDYALYHLMSATTRNNHLNNEVYVHDLDSYFIGSHNCTTYPLDISLNEGFVVRNIDIRPANSVNTAFQLVAVLFQLQSLNQFGGVSAGHIDWTMVPYMRKSFYKHLLNEWFDMESYHVKDLFTNEEAKKESIKRFHIMIDYKEEPFMIGDYSVKSNNLRMDKPIERFIPVWDRAYRETVNELEQAVEGLMHNLNSLMSRSGGQLPFSSICFGTCTIPEGRLVIKAILNGFIKGIGKLHKTSIFPCGIFQLMSGVNKEPGTPNYDLKQLALQSTAKRLYPNYANVDWSGNAGYDRNDPRTYFATMGCRTALSEDINGLGHLQDGRGNICPTTIILPTLAMEAGRDVEKFMKLLDQKIHEAKDSLIERFEWIARQDPRSARFVWENKVMAGYVPEEGIISALKHGTLGIGQLGLAETLQLLIGTDQTTADGMVLAKRIEQLFKDRCAEFKKKYKLNFGVYYTPGFCGRLNREILKN